MDAKSSIEIVIPGEPMPLPRPRFTRGNFPRAKVRRAIERGLRAGWGAEAICHSIECIFEDLAVNVYKSAPQKRYTQLIQDQFIQQIAATSAAAIVPWCGPVLFESTYYFTDSRPEYQLEADVDNLIKMPWDALNGFAWHDDRQVIWGQGSKRIDSEPRSVLKIHFA